MRCLILFIFFSIIQPNSAYCVLTDYLTTEAVDALRMAHQEGLYTVRLLQGEVEGTQRLIVILGETHVRTQREKEVGDLILSHFSCIGQECFDYSKTWGGRAFKWYVDAAVFGFKLSKSRTAESTLNDANLKVNLEKLTVTLVPALETYLTYAETYPPSQLGKLALQLQSSSSPSIDSKIARKFSMTLIGKPEFLDQALRACGFSTDEIRFGMLDRSQIVRLLHRLYTHSLISLPLRTKLQDLTERLSKTQDAPEEDPGEEWITKTPFMKPHTLDRGTKEQLNTYTFSLEEGHDPGIVENLYSLYGPVFAVARLGAIGALVMGSYLPDSVRYGFYTAAAVTTLTDLLSLGIFGQDPIPPTSPIYGFIAGRDRTMAQNIMRTLAQRPQDRTLLGIVGKFHVKGIGDLLKNEGFAEQTLSVEVNGEDTGDTARGSPANPDFTS